MTASPTCSPRASTRRSSGSSRASSSVKRLKSTRQRSSHAPTARTASPTSRKRSKTVCLGGVCVGGGARPTAMSLRPGEKGRRVLSSHLSSKRSAKLIHAQQLPRRRGSAQALRPQRLPSPLFPLLAHGSKLFNQDQRPPLQWRRTARKRRQKNPHRVYPPTDHAGALGPQEAPTAAQGRTSRVHRPQGGGGRTPRDHRRSGRDSTELRPQTWVFGPGGGRGGRGTGVWGRDRSAPRRPLKGRVGRRAHRMSCQAPRCTQKGHGFLRASACDACENADEGRSAAAPPSSVQARPSTRAARTAPVPVAEPLGCLHRRSSELREAHLRSRRAAEARPPRAGGWALCFTSRLK